MTVLDFVQRRLGTVITSAGGIGGECVDLANQFLADMYGDPHEYLNAVDWAGARVPGHAWIANTPSNMPRQGDLVVWGYSSAAGTGPNGHIALALAASQMWVVSCDQNWPTGSPVRLMLHSYAGILGWQSYTGRH